MSAPSWRTPLAVLRAEGARGFLARSVDRLREARRRASYTTTALERVAADATIQVLNVLPFPLAARFGGVALQLSDRLDAERKKRTTALLTFDESGWRLEVDLPIGRRATEGALTRPLAGEAFSAESVAAIEHVAATLGARCIHLENLERLPLTPLAELAERYEVIVSTHDFGLFCPRVQLLELPGEHFCDYSRDLERCARCLASAPRHSVDPEARRAAAARLIGNARALVHPSDFMRRQHALLFGTARCVEAVIPPAIAIAPPPRPRSPQNPPRRIGFFGQASVRKGIADFARAARKLSEVVPRVEWLVVGGGVPEIVASLRRSGVRTVGAYSAGTGARALVRHRIDLAVLPSRYPEAHCLALDECIAANVPVIASEFGALGERIRELRAGTTFGGEPDALERALNAALSAPPTVASVAPSAQPVAEAAVAHMELYVRLAGPASG